MMLRRLTFVALLLAAAGPLSAGGGPQNVLLLVNDNSPDSREVAEHYAKARKIHPRNQLYLKTTTDLRISFKEYAEQIREPLRAYLRESGLTDQVRYIVATQGFPIRVDLPGKGKSVSLCAALQAIAADLEKIETLGLGKGIKRNPFFQAGRSFSHRLELGTRIYLSTMLIGFDKEDAKALVDRALAAESSPPPPGLFLFQDARGNASSRNRQYEQAVTEITTKGFRARRIGPGTGELKGLKPLIVWFSGGSYSGLKREALKQVEFHPGALVDMLESFGAVPKNFRDDGKFSQVPVTWMIEAGATAVHGAVAEPFSLSFPTAQAPLYYLEGYNVAEAVFMATPTFYWKNLLIGDPLCAPYARRPEFVSGLETLLPGPAGGRITLRPEGKDVDRFELYVDGLLAGTATGEEPLTWDTLTLPDGPVTVTVVGLGAGNAAPQAADTRKIPVFNESFRLLKAGLEGGREVAGPADAAMLELSRPPSFPVPDGAILLTGPGEKQLEVDVLQVGRRRLKISPRRPLPPSSRFKLLITTRLEDSSGRRLDGERILEFRTTASGLALRGPAEVTAGEAAAFRVTAEGARRGDAPVDEGFSGEVRLTSDDPKSDQPKPARAEAGRATFTLTMRTAGRWKIRAVHAETGLEGSMEVVVKPAEFAEVDLQAPETWITGNAIRTVLAARDRFGNPTPAASPVLRLFIAGDGPHMAQLKPLDMGRKLVYLPCPWTPGECGLKVLSGTEPVWTGKTVLTPGGLVRWLRLGAFEPESGKPLECPPPPRTAPAAGTVTADGAWRPEGPEGKIQDLKHELKWMKKNRAGWIATGIMSVEDCRVRLRMGLGNMGCRLFLDGRPAGEIPEMRGFRRQAFSNQVKLTPGYHWLGLALTKKGDGPAAFGLELAGAEQGGVPKGVCFYPQDPYADSSQLIISGHVRSGWHGIPKIPVYLEPKVGRRKKCLTSKGGFFFFEGLEPGEYTLLPQPHGFKCKPSSLQVPLSGGNRWDRDFTLVDEKPPLVRILSPRRGARAGNKLNVRARVLDDLGVRVVWWSVDGKEMGGKRWSPPYRVLLDLERLERGRHKLTVSAEDHARNKTEEELIFYKR